jgi:hypothetical protein
MRKTNKLFISYVKRMVPSQEVRLVTNIYIETIFLLLLFKFTDFTQQY